MTRTFKLLTIIFSIAITPSAVGITRVLSHISLATRLGFQQDAKTEDPEKSIHDRLWKTNGWVTEPTNLPGGLWSREELELNKARQNLTALEAEKSTKRSELWNLLKKYSPGNFENSLEIEVIMYRINTPLECKGNLGCIMLCSQIPNRPLPFPNHYSEKQKRSVQRLYDEMRTLGDRIIGIKKFILTTEQQQQVIPGYKY